MKEKAASDLHCTAGFVYIYRGEAGTKAMRDGYCRDELEGEWKYDGD